MMRLLIRLTPHDSIFVRYGSENLFPTGTMVWTNDLLCAEDYSELSAIERQDNLRHWRTAYPLACYVELKITLQVREL